MNTKKMTAFLVGVMLIATVFVMAASAVDDFGRDDYLNRSRMVYEFGADNDTGIYVNDGPTVRIYGEAGAIYPTQSYIGAVDFIYPNHVDPFDPGVIAKDSATFNPAYMANAVSRNDGVSFWDEEKVFFRVFYEPGYDHVIDELMNTTDPYDTDLNYTYMPDGALVTETTYMLVQDGNYRPTTGAAGPGATYDGLTRFMLPVRSPTPSAATQPGMEEDDTVGLYFAENGSIVTDGTIEVGLRVRLLKDGPEARFMDHNVTFEGCSASNAKFMISYIGNKDDMMPEPLPNPTLVPKDDGTWGDPVYVTRYNEPSLTTDAEHRWFIRVIDVACTEYCDVVIGRRLVAGETFYVDGARYDMPAIYVTDEDEFKYITLQSPIPKCYDAVCVEYWKDYSHVSCQWLTMLPECEDVWVLPPFNQDNHWMIDDIGLPKTSCTGGVTVEEEGDIYDTVDALEFYYIKEDTEERFNSSLAERHAYDGSDEIWNWWSIFTKPYHYVELVLPNDEEAGSHDGYEYLITTSFIAPNSEAEKRGDPCKSSEVHDIIDRAATIANAGDDSRDAYLGMPRMAFEYNAVDTEDLFVNDDGYDPTVRIYGETGADYPTHTLEEIGDKAKDFIYPDAVDPFDPGIIPKDSVTFNPAYLDDTYTYVRKDLVTVTEAINVNTEDSDEKVFLRVFYEPGYGHAVDAIMSDHYSYLNAVSMELGALVTETTYMLLTNNPAGHSGDPRVGGTLGTHFMLPVASWNVTDLTPGMDRSGMVDLAYAEHGSMITAGTIEVEESYDTATYSLDVGDIIPFMDHELTLADFNMDGYPIFTIRYVGNMYAEHPKPETHTIERGEKWYFDRGNSKSATSNPRYRWYLSVTEITAGGLVHIKVGRRLVAGETFYVDGIRYDMPAIYVTDEDEFKYITFQSPIPKCGVLWDPPLNMPDWSHVTSQWLANLDENMIVWVLPPFNEPHTMIDDIGILKESCGGIQRTIDSEAGNILGDVDTLEFYYTAEATEDRFDSSLAERHAYGGSGEIWNWWSIFTKPYQYTELWLPNQETDTMADGNEYLITTSFIAPNSDANERGELCKSSGEVHDIIDRAATLLGDAPDDPCDIYDTNGISGIQKDEAVTAINDYLVYETIDKATAVAVLNCYFD